MEIIIVHIEGKGGNTNYEDGQYCCEDDSKCTGFLCAFCAGVACFVRIVDFVCAAGHRVMSPVFAVEYLSATKSFDDTAGI